MNSRSRVPPETQAGNVAKSPATQAHTGDDIIPDAPMIYDRITLLNAPPEVVWPWLLQLGKRRGGWYLKRSYEKLLPVNWRATREIGPQWQQLTVGDRIPDYGTQDDYLEVAIIDAPHALVYRSERYGTTFSWALLLSSEGSGTRLLLRFRGGIISKGWRRKAIIAGGDVLDWLSTTPMLAGLAERVSQS